MPANHFHQLHHRHRIHEVHANDLVRSLVAAPSLVIEIDEVFEARIVSARRDLVQRLENLSFDFQIFRYASITIDASRSGSRDVVA